MPPATDHYAELGLQPSATPDEIKAAYRTLAKRYHPDLHGGDPKATARFQRIGEAFRVLSDPARRLEYHQEMGFRAKVQAAAKATRKAPTRVRPKPSSASSFAETLKHAFMGGFGTATSSKTESVDEAKPTGVRGGDIQTSLRLNPLDLARGGAHTVTVNREQTCRACAGEGTRRGGIDNECPRCLGLGEVPASREGKTVFDPCPECDGRGTIEPIPCPACDGQGRVTSPAEVRVTVPPNAPAGEEIRVAGAGHPGRAGGPPGDVLVRVEEIPDPTVRRAGDRLVIRTDADLLEALGGREVEIDTPAGLQSLRLRPEVLRGEPMVLEGKGVERSDGRRGDVVLEVTVKLPDRLTPRSIDLLRQLVREPGFRPGKDG